MAKKKRNAEKESASNAQKAQTPADYDYEMSEAHSDVIDLGVIEGATVTLAKDASKNKQ